jgi:nucleotide-binding universal stress UspA family protein
MLKDIMVHLDGSTEDEIRLGYGQAIASAWRAHLIGIFTNLLPDFPFAVPMEGTAAVQIVAELKERARQEGDATSRRLAERLSSLQVPGELRRFDGTVDALCATVSEQARCADLFIATRPYRNADTLLWDDLIEAVLFGSGHALLLVPPGRRWEGEFRTVLIAWNGSREAARAVNEGLRFIDQAARIVLLVIDADGESRPWAGIADHLKRHGIMAEVATAEGQGRRTGDVILDEARRVSANLVIMGGYGHTRLRERVLGGASLDVLTGSELPVLMAH